MTQTNELLERVKQADEDFEWYPSTTAMINAVLRWIPNGADSLMDIGAGDGRVLKQFAEKCKSAKLYAIEKSTVLIQAQPEEVIPVGAEFYEQNLACLPVDYIFCNPPYSQFESWATIIIESGYATKAFLVVPRRWQDSVAITQSLKRRKATVRTIHSDDFFDADRAARAIVDIIEVTYPTKDKNYRDEVEDPFDIWFDQNIDTFDREEKIADDVFGNDVAKINPLKTIGDMVAAYNEEYGRMEENYKAIFLLDYAILKELGITKQIVREGIKLKMIGLKTKYWQMLFDGLTAITNRLCTKTKKQFLEKITGRATIAFTSSNAYAVVLWAIKHANKYYDEQLIELYRSLSTAEGIINYKSNQKVWKEGRWRYHNEDHTHYALDYRIVLQQYQAIFKAKENSFRSYEFPGNLHDSAHEMIADVIAVLYNLGYATYSQPSRFRQWTGGSWQDFYTSNDTDEHDEVLFQVKAYMNGNLHFRFNQKAIKRLNVEAGRLLKWINTPEDVVTQLGYTMEEAKSFFKSSFRLGVSNIKLLGSAPSNN